MSMKKWYQYRCEEAGFNDPQSAFLSPSRFATRFNAFLFRKAIEGGIHWQFTVGWSDWRAVYGKEG